MGDLAARALAADDPAVLDQLLALPQVHLVVDGYNVTKTGYGTLSLAEQRSRLVNGLGVLAGRTRAEVTCVFDGTTLDSRVIQAAPDQSLSASRPVSNHTALLQALACPCVSQTSTCQ